MTRIQIAPRNGWREKVERVGLVYHTPNGQTYWDESVCYRFSAREIEQFEAATEEVQQLCLKAGQFILDQGRMDALGIPARAQPVIRAAWEAEPPSIYGRFDFAYDGEHPPKLLEYNANTPTALLEAAVVQWYWLQDVFPKKDQFNSIHEKLVAKWTDLRPYLRGKPLYFACMPNDEDLMTVSYLRDTAQSAHIETAQLFVREIGWNEKTLTFRDLKENVMTSLFALYPWEWLLADMPEQILGTYASVDWIEPIWKMLWSNKGLLAVLWEMFPGHPHLLASYLDGPRGMADYVKKPLLSREGANVALYKNGDLVRETAGPYGAGGFVYQEAAPEWESDGNTPVIGSWYITDMGPAGMGIREAQGITGNLSRFVPHYFE